MNWTPKKVGDVIGVSDRQIRNIIAKLGIVSEEKIGNQPIYTDADFRRIQKYHANNDKPGPKKKGTK